jgi:hypothetical protein
MKSSQKLELILVNFWRFFEKNCAQIIWAIFLSKKNSPEHRNMRPNFEISPNLVTLILSETGKRNFFYLMGWSFGTSLTDKHGRRGNAPNVETYNAELLNVEN